MWSIDGAVPKFTQMLDEVDEDAQNAALEVCALSLCKRPRRPASHAPAEADT